MESGPSQHWQALVQQAATEFTDVGACLCLTGMVSASLMPEPALFAGGPDGALLRIRLASAAPMVGELEKAGEMELIPPRDSCFRALGVRRGAKVSDWSERVWERTVVLLEQIRMRIGCG